MTEMTGNGDGIVEIFTDGACSGNPGPGGWGAILRWRGVERELSGSERDTTNNRMELLAAIRGLEAPIDIGPGPDQSDDAAADDQENHEIGSHRVAPPLLNRR